MEQFAFAGESITTTALTPEELDAKVKGTTALGRISNACSALSCL